MDAYDKLRGAMLTLESQLETIIELDPTTMIRADAILTRLSAALDESAGLEMSEREPLDEPLDVENLMKIAAYKPPTNIPFKSR